MFSHLYANLKFQKARAAPDPLVKKRNQDAEEGSENKRQRIEQLPLLDRLKNSTVPYWNIPYEDQVNSFSNFNFKIDL